jgi:hypothetical protein
MRMTGRSVRVSGRAVPDALCGLLGAKSYDVGEVCCDSCSVKSSAALGFAYPLSLTLALFIFPSPRKRVALCRPEAEEVEVKLEVLVV